MTRSALNFPELRDMLLRVRFAADPQSRHDGRQHRHRFADRRFARRCCWRWMRRWFSRRPSGERVLPLEDFFVAYRKTALQPGEILKSILIPRMPSGIANACAGSSKFRSGARWTSARWPACFAVDLDDDGTIGTGAAGLRRRGRDAGARARRRKQALIGKPLETRKRAKKFCRSSERNSRRSPMCAAARLSAAS